MEPISRIADVIGRRLAELRGHDLNQIARKAGFSGRDVLEMFASGEARVPFDAAVRLGRALDLPPPAIFRLIIEQYWPAEQVDLIIPPVSETERELLRIVREALQGAELVLTPEKEAALRQLFAT